MSLAEDRLAPGGNNPPPELKVGDDLREALAREHAALVKRKDDLLAAEVRVPAEIADEDQAKKAADYIKLVSAAAKAANTVRVGTKEPYLEGGRIVDGFFTAGICEPLTSLKGRVEVKLNAYLRRKAEAERKLREAEARSQAEEAARAAREAAEREAAMQQEADLAPAIEAEERAAQAQADAAQAAKAADAKPAELSRTRGDLGAVASLRRVWVGEIVDRERLDLDALRPHLAEADMQKALNAFVRAGGRELRGASIYENTSAVVR